MKKYSSVLFCFLIWLIIMACSSDDSATEEELGDIASTDYDISAVLSLFEGTGLSYETVGNTVVFTTSNLPNHKSPYWPTTNSLYEAYNGTNTAFNLNPNTISAQSIVFTISLKPSEASTHEPTNLGPIGISRNGVVFYNQYAGPNNQALTNEIDSFDQWLGHPQNSGQYHYHIEPTYLTNEFGEDAFLGVLADGFPVYGPMENGVTIAESDLDDYHGHTGVTPEFPNGIYHYHVTATDPYINGNGYFGTAGNITQ